MVNYLKLGFKSDDEYMDEFFKTILPSNRTYGYYVDWKKINGHLQDSLVEISILNSLNKVPDGELEDKFREILEHYPNVVPLLPLIIAIRDNKVPVFDFDTKKLEEFDFRKKGYDVDKIVQFAVNSGILNLFRDIDDLYSYLMGVEVGLDTNSRKNRSGHIFEDIVGDFLNGKFEDVNHVRIEKEDSSLHIDRVKRIDYVVYVNNKPKYAIECNFYGGSGSKPIEVAHAYARLQNDLDKYGITFVWVTDGLGWKKMAKALRDIHENIEYLVNYDMLLIHADEIFDV